MSILAFLGPDGAGKSTLIEELQRVLTDQQVEVMHFRVTLRSPINQPVTDPYSKPTHSFVVACAKLIWWHILYAYWGLTRLMRRSHRNQCVIFDRFLYDIVFDPARYRISSCVARLPWHRMVWPKPTLVVILDPPTEVVRSRKQEVMLEHTLAQKAAYSRMVGRPNVLYVPEPLHPQQLCRTVLDHLGNRL